MRTGMWRNIAVRSSHCCGVRSAGGTAARLRQQQASSATRAAPHSGCGAGDRGGGGGYMA